MEFIMKKLFNFRRLRKATFDATSARARMNRTMPGEVGALASIRLTGISV